MPVAPPYRSMNWRRSSSGSSGGGASAGSSGRFRVRVRVRARARVGVRVRVRARVRVSLQLLRAILGDANVHELVEAAWPEQSGVEQVGPVGGGEGEDLRGGLHAVTG